MPDLFQQKERRTKMPTSVMITLIICITLVAISFISRK